MLDGNSVGISLLLEAMNPHTEEISVEAEGSFTVFKMYIL